MAGKRVLIVDDDAEIATMLSRALLRRGFTIETTSSADVALVRAAEGGFDAALIDLVMPGQDGMAVVQALLEKRPDMKVALLTGYAHSPLLAAAERKGVAVFMKPTPIHEVVEFLQSDES